MAKDGAELPAERKVARPARLPISIGETYDVEITPDRAGELRFEIRTALGVVIGTMAIRVRE